MKHISSLIFVCTIFVLLLPGRTAKAELWLSGRVVNGTDDGRAVGKQKVLLYESSSVANDQKPLSEATTDHKGTFRFRLADSLINGSFYPATRFQQVDYHGQSFKLDQKESLLDDLVVYETTDSDANIAVSMQHVIITPGTDGLKIKDVYFVQNTGKRTFTGGEQVAADKFSTFSIPVPADAENVSVSGDLMSCCSVVKDGRLHETMPLKPGYRQEIVTYDQPVRDRSFVMNRHVVYPTAVLDILIPDSAVVVQAAGLVGMGTLNIKGLNYSHYKIEQIAAGTNLRISLAGLPGKPMDFKWPVLLVAGIIIMAFIAYGIWRRRQSEKPSPANIYANLPPSKVREVLLLRIASLDDLAADGKIEKETYQSERARLKERILLLADLAAK